MKLVQRIKRIVQVALQKIVQTKKKNLATKKINQIKVKKRITTMHQVRMKQKLMLSQRGSRKQKK